MNSDGEIKQKRKRLKAKARYRIFDEP